MIEFNEIVKDNEYRERVIKHFRLPIRLSVSKEKFDSDLEFIKETQPTKYAQIIELTEHDFNKEVERQGTNTPDFSLEHVLEPIIEEFEATEKWQEFLKQDYSDVLDDYEGITSTHGFYTKENDGKYFLSIDLETANWQSLHSILGLPEKYEDLMSKRTDLLIPPMSKTFRTKITGVMGARNIMHYNKKLLKDNLDSMLAVIGRETGIKPGLQPFAFYADEALFEIDEWTHNELKQYDFEDAVSEKIGISVHITTFKLKWLEVEKSCVKVFNDKNFEILNISKDIKLLIDKDSYGFEVNEVDFEKINLRNKSKDEYLQMIKDVNLKIESELTESRKSAKEFENDYYGISTKTS